MARVPTNLITGYLGVGKTTATIRLLRQRPPGSRWAVLVNEFGEVAIDQVPLADAAGSGVVIREVAGGCLCCSADVPMDVAVDRIVRQARPERLLIETTGVGHPWRMLDLLRSERLADRVEVGATVCLIDPRRLDDPRAVRSPAFQDQIHLADVLVANKADLAAAGQLARFMQWAESLFPPKLHVATVDHGQLQAEWLELDPNPLRVPLFPEAHARTAASGGGERLVGLSAGAISSVEPGRPHRRESRGAELSACGWVFSPDDAFDEDRLMELLFDVFDVERLKGVFRIGDEWILINRTATETETSFVAYRRDSRLEVIAGSRSLDTDAWEARLLACLRPNAGCPP